MNKDRLTITLRKDILAKIDHLIDKTNIRNRSHAIETLLSQALAPRLDTAVILAGGKGVKLRPLTYELPKSLVPVKGRPLLEYTIELLKNANVKNIIICLGYLGEKIIKHFGDGEKFGVKIRYCQEEKPVGTAGALREAASWINGTFLTLHGDILTKINLFDLLHFHSKENLIATMALTTTSETEAFGNVRVRGTRILEFLEKPKKGHSLSLLINAGIYVFTPAIFSYIPKKGVSFLEEDIFPLLAKDGKLAGFTFDGAWFDITTSASYEKALKLWQS